MYTDHFSINNIPFGIATSQHHPTKAVATRFEDSVLFLDEIYKAGNYFPTHISEEIALTFSLPAVNAFAALSKSEHNVVRTAIQDLIKNKRAFGLLTEQCLSPITSATLHMPLAIGDFTDYSCSLNHVLNASEAVFGKREAPPAFDYFPVGYTARTSSIVISGTDIRRPKGMMRGEGGKVEFGATGRLDYELEIAAVVGKNSKLGEPVRIEDADNYIFGLLVLNDWSARDIQGLEMTPLGPLNGKSFSTTISPWIITLEALAPFSSPVPPRHSATSEIPYLKDPKPNPTYSLDLMAGLRPHGAAEPSIICKSKFSSMYWTLRDLIVQQTTNGCNINVGDLLATGTISGDTRNSRGCLMELAGSGGLEVVSKNGEKEKRIFIEDGDTIVLSAIAGPGVGFGSCEGLVLPAG